MSSAQKDGGPAFPTPVEAIGHNEIFNIINAPGMSLRDWFAGQALAEVYQKGGRYGDEGMKQVAEYAYQMADAMIAQRDNGDGQ